VAYAIPSNGRRKNKMKVMSVVGARPNFMKIAPFIQAVERHNAEGGSLQHMLVHTGQHYDERMFTAFFSAFGISPPDVNLEVGSGTHAQQVGRTMIAFEKVVCEHRPDCVVVVGDVNATIACSITAKKEHVKLAHIEAGLRSFDLDMPEEINRMVTDRLSDLLFTTDSIASENLLREGTPPEKIRLVGNVMIDTLESQRKRAAALDVDQIIGDNLVDEAGTKGGPFEGDGDFAVMTVHRPSNVDAPAVLEQLLRFVVQEVCADMPVLWAVHPRTLKQVCLFGLWDVVRSAPNLILLQPLGYHQMLRLNMGTKLMLTDSGGLQEECCVLGTPCLTLRWNTERPITLREHGGASILVGNSLDLLRSEYEKVRRETRRPQRPPYWDGQTADRIVAELVEAGRLGWKLRRGDREPSTGDRRVDAAGSPGVRAA
jgi:UDP-N-acetylglucosamine 2-epimerase (non-hydrolysing)